MTAVVQRVKRASLRADGEARGEMGRGLYILLGVREGDTERDADVLAEKIPKLRIFEDEAGKMNLSLSDVGGEVYIVSNFTLLANYAHGNRPDYLAAAKPDRAVPLYERFVCAMKDRVAGVYTGVFGADMQTEMTTDGPVTLVLSSDVLLKKGDNS